MKFNFSGSYLHFISCVHIQAIKFNRETKYNYELFEHDEKHFSLGIGRTGHNTGCFYNAVLNITNDNIEIDGKIEYSGAFKPAKSTFFGKLGNILLTTLFFCILFLFFSGVPFLLFKLFGLTNYIAPVIIPFLLFVWLRISAICGKIKKRDDFVMFMVDFMNCVLVQ